MRTLKLTLAYDGTAYAGWQYQPDQVTVQETLEDAIAKVTGQKVRVLASGRTDAGVHALGQVVGFRTESRLPPEVFRRAINANLPDDIAVLKVADVADNFHAISHVHCKCYRYVIHDGPAPNVFHRHYAWHYVYGRLDAEAMQRAAAALLGTHDFSSFETAGAPRVTSVRTIFRLTVQRSRAGEGGLDGVGGVERTNANYIDRDAAGMPGKSMSDEGRAGDGDFIVIEVEADGFLYNMVRAIVGTLVEVGRGRRAESWPGKVLRAANRSAAGPTAPPQGLCLVRVEY
jgi:tRNA pseudouridine38-40 synthase